MEQEQGTNQNSDTPATKKSVDAVREMIQKWEEKEEDRNLVSTLWLKMRGRNVSELLRIAESRINRKSSKLMKIGAICGLSVASGTCASMMTPLTTGVTLGIAGICAVSFGAGWAAEKAKMDGELLNTVRHYFNSDLCETEGFLDIIKQEIELLNEIRDTVKDVCYEKLDMLQNQSSDLWNCEDLLKSIDSSSHDGKLSFDCSRKIIVVLKNKLDLLTAIQEILEESVSMLKATLKSNLIISEDPWYRVFVKPFQCSPQLGINSPQLGDKRSLHADIDYMMEENDDPDGFVQVKRKKSNVDEDTGQNSELANKNFDLHMWLEEKGKFMNGTMTKVQSLLNQMKI